MAETTSVLHALNSTSHSTVYSQLSCARSRTLMSVSHPRTYRLVLLIFHIFIDVCLRVNLFIQDDISTFNVDMTLVIAFVYTLQCCCKISTETWRAFFRGKFQTFSMKRYIFITFFVLSR